MIKIEDAHLYFGGKDLYPTFDSRKLFIQRIEKLIKAGVVIGKNEEVELQSLRKRLSYEAFILQNYLSFPEMREKIKFSYSNSTYPFKKFLESKGTDSPFEYVFVEYPINSIKLFISKHSIDRFISNYISLDEMISRCSQLENKQYKNNICFKLKINSFQLGMKRYFKRSDFEKILKHLESMEVNSDHYYSLDEFKQILSVTLSKHYLQIEEEYSLITKRDAYQRKYYIREVVDSLKIRQDALKEKYMSLAEIKEIALNKGYFNSINSFNSTQCKVKGEPIDSLLRPLFKDKRIMYSREAVNTWFEKIRIKRVLSTVSMESDFDTFKYRLEVSGINLNELGPFTSENWLQFVSSRLNRSKSSVYSKQKYINSYVNETEHLINLVSSTKKLEIYSVTSNDINILFNQIPLNNAMIIYQFAKKVYYKLKNQKLETFDLKRVTNPYNITINPKDKSIYEYKKYKKLYNYAQDISLHKERAILDTLNIISGKGSKRTLKYYASSWLYILLHLNNAWRHSDAVSFPQVNLSGTQIIDLDWMLRNELSDEDTDYIINQVYRAEFIISKTQVKNYFFCSKELKKPFATAIAICQLRTNAISPFHESLIDFSTKGQQFTETRSRRFFELFGEEQFLFSSRKMNRSLMSYVYVILSKTQKGTAGLKTIQKMRGHLKQETTNFYVDIPEEDLNFLSKQLFARESFGFVYDTFLDVLQGVEIDREKRTTEIQCIQNYFGDIHKIEEISSFLNVIHTDRKTVLDRILSMGFDEALEFLNKIETGQLPSKKENIQCMFAESGCVKTGQGVDCFDCAFSIPNYYALSSLGASLQDRLNRYLESQKLEIEKPFYEQRKRARLFYIQLELFAQAIQRFGFDVYEFITDPRAEFIEKQKNIGSLKELYRFQQ